MQRRKLGTRDFYQTPHKLHKLGLTWKGLLAYSAISFHCDKELTCYPSMAKMAKTVGIGLNTVRDGVKELVEAGVVFAVGRGQNGEQWSNKYVIQPISRWGLGAATGNIRSTKQDHQGKGWAIPEYCGMAN